MQSDRPDQGNVDGTGDSTAGIGRSYMLTRVLVLQHDVQVSSQLGKATAVAESACRVGGIGQMKDLLKALVVAEQQG